MATASDRASRPCASSRELFIVSFARGYCSWCCCCCSSYASFSDGDSAESATVLCCSTCSEMGAILRRGLPEYMHSMFFFAHREQGDCPSHRNLDFAQLWHARLMRLTLLRFDWAPALCTDRCLLSASRLANVLPQSEQACGRSSEWHSRWRDMCSCLLKPGNQH